MAKTAPVNTCSVVISSGLFVVTFTRDNKVARVDTFQLWKDATRAMLLWL